MIKTNRLILRPWHVEDFEPFAELDADPKVMEYFPALLTRHESDELAQKIIEKMEKQGWGLWAASLVDSNDFIGFIGLAIPTFEAHFTPAIEVGWHLAYQFWGQGYATERALAALNYGFNTLGLNEIVSFTATSNSRSRQVMKKIGLHHNQKDDFDHPKLPEGHQLKKLVLYRLKADEYQKQQNVR